MTRESDAPLGPLFGGVGVFWGEEASLLLRGGYAVGLYERLLLEAAELPEDPNRERNERMWTYLKNLRRPVPEGGGYVTSEELEQEQQRYLTDIRKLRALLIRAPGGMAGGYWLAHLKSRYPTEYAQLRDVRSWSR